MLSLLLASDEGQPHHLPPGHAGIPTAPDEALPGPGKLVRWGMPLLPLADPRLQHRAQQLGTESRARQRTARSRVVCAGWWTCATRRACSRCTLPCGAARPRPCAPCWSTGPTSSARASRTAWRRWVGVRAPTRAHLGRAEAACSGRGAAQGLSEVPLSPRRVCAVAAQVLAQVTCNGGSTPLHVAALRNDPGMVELLLKEYVQVSPLGRGRRWGDVRGERALVRRRSGMALTTPSPHTHACACLHAPRLAAVDAGGAGAQRRPAHRHGQVPLHRLAGRQGGWGAPTGAVSAAWGRLCLPSPPPPAHSPAPPRCWPQDLKRDAVVSLLDPARTLKGLEPGAVAAALAAGSTTCERQAAFACARAGEGGPGGDLLGGGWRTLIPRVRACVGACAVRRLTSTRSSGSSTNADRALAASSAVSAADAFDGFAALAAGTLRECCGAWEAQGSQQGAERAHAWQRPNPSTRARVHVCVCAQWSARPTGRPAARGAWTRGQAARSSPRGPCPSWRPLPRPRPRSARPTPPSQCPSWEAPPSPRPPRPRRRPPARRPLRTPRQAPPPHLPPLTRNHKEPTTRSSSRRLIPQGTSSQRGLGRASLPPRPRPRRQQRRRSHTTHRRRKTTHQQQATRPPRPPNSPGPSTLCSKGAAQHRLQPALPRTRPLQPPLTAAPQRCRRASCAPSPTRS